MKHKRKSPCVQFSNLQTEPKAIIWRIWSRLCRWGQRSRWIPL